MIYFTIQYKIKNISTNTFLAEEQDVLDLAHSIELIAPLSVAGEELFCWRQVEAGELWGQPAGQVCWGGY